MALGPPPGESTHWTGRELAKAAGVSLRSVQRILEAHQSPDIRLNYGTAVWGQTGRLFLPLNFLIGWKPTENTVISVEFGIQIIKEFPAYTFKIQVRIGYLF